MNRYFITIEYDGTNFIGWQKQNSGPSIQECIEIAVERFTNSKITLYGAGRTDAGVHASGQVAHLDLPKKFDSYQIVEAINAHLINQRIKIINVNHVKEDAHARFSALWRKYKYFILNRQAPPAINEGYVWHQKRTLDIEKMRTAAKFLTGTHDFSSFRATHCQSKSAIKTLDSLSLTKIKENIVITAKARSFLHHQVRNIVGSLKLVGSSKWEPEYIVDVINKKNRTAAGPTAPAEGLYLTEIKYPKKVYF
tara:strand:- start:8657 stop:9412 length:756 start_codon:yes stop_codon:yes gene_type:complete